MDRGVAEFLKRTIVLIIKSSPLLTRILWQSDEEMQHDIDLECQYTTLPHDGNQGSSQFLHSTTEQPFLPTGQDTLKDYVPSDDPDSHVEPLDEPTRVILQHGGDKKRLALLITEDLVFRTQKVVNEAKKLRAHGKTCENIEKDILSAERHIEETTAKVEAAIVDDDTEDLQKQLEFWKDVLESTCEKRDYLARDLNIFQNNLAHAKEASHTFLLDILGNAGLLELPEPELEAKSEPEVAEQADNGATSPKAKSLVLDDEEALFRKGVWKELGECTEELEEAERIFSNLDAVYEEEAEQYEAAVADGECSLARSDFDCMFLDNNRKATTRLMQAQKAFKAKKRQAKALGVVGSDWGDDLDYGEYEAPSMTSGEWREYNASRDWSSIQNWIDSRPETESLRAPESRREDVEVDDWNARLGYMWDSISAVDRQEDHRDNFELWDEMRPRGPEDESMAEGLNEEQGDGALPMETSYEQEVNMSLMEE